MKWVSHPLGAVCPGNASKPLAKSIPNNPKAGMKTLNPTPAERFNEKGL
jgi:hypothetical protein